MAKKNRTLRVIGAVLLIILLIVFLLMMVFGQAPDSIETHVEVGAILPAAGKVICG